MLLCDDDSVEDFCIQLLLTQIATLKTSICLLKFIVFVLALNNESQYLDNIENAT